MKLKVAVLILVNVIPRVTHLHYNNVERFNGTIRKEALDHFLLISEKQVRQIIKEYVTYNNNYRMHQWIGKTPVHLDFPEIGLIKKKSILGGLHHNFFRSSA